MNVMMKPSCFGSNPSPQAQAENCCHTCNVNWACLPVHGSVVVLPQETLIEEKIVFMILPRRVMGLGHPCLTMLLHVLRRKYMDWSSGEVWFEYWFIGHAP